MSETLKILMVDDDASFRSALSRLFRTVRKKMPVDLTQVSSGAEMMSTLETLAVDCVLIDYQMPGGTGLEWLHILHEAHPELPVIMMTGFGDQQLAVDAIKAGAADYLVKGSVSIGDLQRAIYNAVDKSSMVKQIAEQHQILSEAQQQSQMQDRLHSASDRLSPSVERIQLDLQTMKSSDPSDDLVALIESCSKEVVILQEALMALSEGQSSAS